jgi:hypothetical protein
LPTFEKKKYILFRQLPIGYLILAVGVLSGYRIISGEVAHQQTKTQPFAIPLKILTFKLKIKEFFSFNNHHGWFFYLFSYTKTFYFYLISIA